jgi:hypothetical protein
MRFALAWLALTACAPEDAATPLPPPGTLTLTATDAIGGQTLIFEVSGAAPGDRVWLLRGPDQGTTCPAALPFCVDLDRPRPMADATANANGVATWSFPLPTTIPVGMQQSFQAAVVASADTSNALDVVVLDPAVKPDFGLVDVSPTSATSGEVVSPRDYLEQVSGWYFGHSS